MDSAHRETADWNVVVTISEPTFHEASRLLRQWGKIRRTGFHNVIGVAVAEPRRFLDEFAASVGHEPGLLNFVSHVVPADHVFDFRDEADFASRARETVLGWAPRLAGKSFLVRMHRRGLKGAMHAHDEERMLADAILAQTAAGGSPAHVALDDPDCVVLVETIGNRAGLSFWSREERQKFPFLGID